MTNQLRMTPKAWGLLLLLSLIWGGSFPANRAALSDIPVYTTVAFRVLLGAATLWVIVWVRGLKVPNNPLLLPIFLGLGLVNCAMPFTLIVWGQQYIDSGLASILNAGTAIFTVLLAATVFADEKLSVNKVTGILIGLVGVITVIGFDAFRSINQGSLGQWAVVAATICYAIGTTSARKFLRGVPPLVSSAGMLTGAAAVMIPMALFVEGTPDFAYSGEALIGVVYLGLIASSVAYFLYYTLIALAGAGNVSLVTLLVTPVAIILGAVIYGEALPWNAYFGFVILAFGLAVLDGRVRISKTR